MAYGLQFKNENNEVLVNSDFEHYHFAGKGQLSSHFVTPPLTGGTLTAHSYSGSTTLSSTQIPGRVYVFTLSARASTNSPAPLVFIKRKQNKSMGHVLTKRNGTNWEFWILSDQNQYSSSNLPELYCFLPLDEMSSSAATPASGDNYGIATYKSDGTKTYDSRIKPLKVIATVDMPSAPAYARPSITANYNPVFTPNSSSSSSDFSGQYSGSVSNLMYCCPSIAHCCQDVEHQSAGEGFQPQGLNNSYFYSWARADLWWGFYRNTFSINQSAGFSSTSQAYSTQTPYAYGHVWNSIENQSGILAALVAIALSFVTFGASLLTLGVFITAAVLASSFSGIAADGGLYYPYRNDSRNRNEKNPMILATWSQYD